MNPTFQPGARVRYLFGDRDTGTIVNRNLRKENSWMVRWDHDPHGPRLLDAYEENLELLRSDGQLKTT